MGEGVLISLFLREINFNTRVQDADRVTSKLSDKGYHYFTLRKSRLYSNICIDFFFFLTI